MAKLNCIVIYGPRASGKTRLGNFLKEQGIVDSVWEGSLPRKAIFSGTIVIILDGLTQAAFEYANEIYHIDHAKFHFGAHKLDFPVEQWQKEVSDGKTVLGYYEWLREQTINPNRFAA